MATRVVARAATAKRSLPTKAAIILTQTAVNRIRDLMKSQPEAVGLKISVKERGCNGLSYSMDYVKAKDKLDEEVVQDGVRILIDRKAQLSLLGTEMDFIENKISAEFVFNNPNIKGTCGCGESFTM